jgi:hypothetical protein
MIAATLVAQTAAAEERIPDGVYGRFDGDLNVSLGAGATFAHEGTGGALLARALFLETAGFYVSYADRMTSADGGPRRSLGLGVALRPLFIPRWGYDLERGPATLDLAIDATTIELGALWTADGSAGFSHAPGIEFGLGTEMPLAARATGPWLGVRASLRWRDSELSGVDDAAPLRPAILLTLAWHAMVATHLVDLGDRRLR